jgi:hypothetical protein
MNRLRNTALLLVVMLQSGLTVSANRATPTFPSDIDFHLAATSAVPIESAEIKIQTDALTCGEAATRAAADEFTGGQSITANWSWNLRKTGALPPGTTITWSWLLYPASGDPLETEPSQLVWEDKNHTWQSTRNELLTLNWYQGDQDFAQALVDAASVGLTRLHDSLGLASDGNIRVYIYASPDDMQSSTLYAPSWSGGLAFAEHDALLIGIGPNDLDWGERAIAHELTHIVAGRATFSCVDSTPIWFAEGLAMHFEGEPDPPYVQILNDAIRANSLLSVRELSSIFSGNPDLARQSYAQSLSLVTYLIEVQGSEKLLALLDQFKQGSSEDKALEAVYGFNRDGLEAAWRAWVGAQPMPPVEVQPDAAFTPYPTYPPLNGAPLAQTEVLPTPNYLNEPDAGTPVPMTSMPEIDFNTAVALMVYGVICCVCLIISAAAIGTGIWWFMRGRQSQSTPPGEMQ